MSEQKQDYPIRRIVLIYVMSVFIFFQLDIVAAIAMPVALAMPDVSMTIAASASPAALIIFMHILP